MPLILSLKKAAAAGISLRFIQVPLGEGLPLALRCWMLTADADGILGLSSVYSQGCMADEAAGTLLASQPTPASAAGESYLRSLEALRQFLTYSLFNDSRAGKSDQ